jgi:addiction module HigA family antidote
MKNKQNNLDPIHPGEILREDFLEPLGISINQLSRDLSVPPNRISEIVNGKRAITADTALRLERYFGIEAQTHEKDLYSTSIIESEKHRVF